MRHFAYLTDEQQGRLFVRPPNRVSLDSSRDVIATALGATLYCPSTRPHLDRDALRVAAAGATSMVWCLEDAIPADSLATAEDNVVAALQRLHLAEVDTREILPLLFIRVRSVDQIRRLARRAGAAIAALTGFSLPKVGPESALAMLTAIREVSAAVSRPIYAMPILETPEIAYVETRRNCLRDLADVFAEFDDHVLCVRVGGTDLSGMFGLRRDRDTTIWDVAVVRDAMSDILNQFTRNGAHVVTGAVWEHIPGARLFKPQLRESPFLQQHATSLRQRMISTDVDALMREISLDKNNGLCGKTVIHPTHVSVVNSMLTVNRDEYDDALAIAAHGRQEGVLSSQRGRMNESGPHRLWADQIAARSAAYGVLADDAALIELLSIGQRVVEEVYRPSAQQFRVVS